MKDIALKELSLPFITDYETFLRTDKHLKINSAMVFVRNLGLPLQRSLNRNREFNAWSQEHKDNPGVCQDYQGKIEQRRGKVVSAD